MAPRTSFHGTAYRVTHPDYHDLDTTIEMSRAFPGRFNPLGVGAVYVALEPQTAIDELKRRAAKANRRPGSFAPRVLFALDVYLRSVLDLTDPGTRAEWDITLDDLRTDNLPHGPTGRAAIRRGTSPAGVRRLRPRSERRLPRPCSDAEGL